MSDRYCIVIPHYRHHRPLAALLPKLYGHGLEIMIVDDASGDASLTALHTLVAAQEVAHESANTKVRLIIRERNGGKGAAMITGLRCAAEAGYTHVISLDADGQHTPLDVGKLHTLSKSLPDSLISGKPVFGADIPASRLYGRMLTNRLVQIVTGSTMIKDAMCGLRVYPLAQVLPLCERLGKRTRMEFDVEILVRACWAGMDIRAVDTAVIYPEDGESHFRLFKDNARLVGMHILLILGGLARVPRRLFMSKSRMAPIDERIE